MKFLNEASILVPNKNISYNKFSVVACDQYTSQPEYWEEVEKLIDESVSAYNMVFPEIYLELDGFERRIKAINDYMDDCYNKNYFCEYPNSMFYIERTLENGKVRKGIVATIDLEHYDFKSGTENYIRATEGTVLERIPPRVKIRQNALLEIPHVMLLVDDDNKAIIEPLSSKIGEFELVYDFDLMQNSGSIKGYKLDKNSIDVVHEILSNYADSEYFNEKYSVNGKAPMLFAAGDGNHSLATAKECYEKIKNTSNLAAKNHPARYALVELVNLHDESLEFEAIHRVIFDVNPEFLMQKMKEKLNLVEGEGAEQVFCAVVNGKSTTYSITNPNRNICVGTVDSFINGFLYEFSGKVDYIHGEDVVNKITEKHDDSIGFIFPAMHKSQLFKTVILDGALPRKTFSMGHASDKRFYFESRIIRKDA